MDAERKGLINIIRMIDDSISEKAHILTRIVEDVYTRQFPDGSREAAEIHGAIRKLQHASAYLKSVQDLLRVDLQSDSDVGC